MADPVTKDEMARRLGVCLPTLSAWLHRWPDFPVLERGAKGRPWRFDPEAVKAFVARKQQEREAVEAERDRLLRSFQLPDDLVRPPAQIMRREAWVPGQEVLSLPLRYTGATSRREPDSDAAARVEQALAEVAAEHDLPATVSTALRARILAAL